ncbi:MAG TPA: hypothetical protein VGU20_11250, partial [Stellaceae bacterium]|nr:hypothetical protein [Stellaceae bacterium]
MTALAAVGFCSSAAQAGEALVTCGLRMAPGPAENSRAAARIGRAYLREVGRTLDPVRLSQELALRLGLAEPIFSIDEALMRASIEAAVREDFAHNDTHNVGGWVLARTELEFCALVALGYRA